MRSRTAVRISLLLIVMCALLGAQTVSAACGGSHEHSSQHCCGFCHAGPLAFLQPAAAATLTPVFVPGWLDLQDGPGAPPDARLSSGSSRAPPSVS
jgi:hypothetical protein